MIIFQLRYEVVERRSCRKMIVCQMCRWRVVSTGIVRPIVHLRGTVSGRKTVLRCWWRWQWRSPRLIGCMRAVRQGRMRLRVGVHSFTSFFGGGVVFVIILFVVDLLFPGKPGNWFWKMQTIFRELLDASSYERINLGFVSIQIIRQQSDNIRFFENNFGSRPWR